MIPQTKVTGEDGKREFLKPLVDKTSMDYLKDVKTGAMASRDSEMGISMEEVP